MAIPAVRFSVFDTDTNLPISDLTSVEYGGVLNNPILTELADMTAKFEDITKNLFDTKDLLSFDFQKKFDETVFEVKGILGGIKDFAKSTISQVENFIKDLFPNNPIAQSIFSQMTEKCRKSAMSKQGFGKPYDVGYKCGGKTRGSGNRGCTTSSFSNLLNQITGGAYNGIHQDLNSALKALMGLASFGYRMNMCGVFNALASGFGLGDKGFLARAGAGVLSVLGNIKNPLGVFDLASTTAALGLNIAAELPNAAKSVFDSVAGNFFPKKDLESVGERMLGSAEIFDSGYETADILEANSGALQEILETQAYDQPFSLETPKDDDISRVYSQSKIYEDDPPAVQYVPKCACIEYDKAVALASF